MLVELISIFFKPELNGFLDLIFSYLVYSLHIINSISIAYFDFRSHSLLLSLRVNTEFYHMGVFCI